MSVVFTVGYEGTDTDRFVQTLKAAGVERLADVRAVAASRKAGFSKTKLAARLADEASSIRISSPLVIPNPAAKQPGPEILTCFVQFTARTSRQPQRKNRCGN